MVNFRMLNILDILAIYIYCLIKVYNLNRLRGKPPKLCIIQEKTKGMENLLITEFSPDLKFCINTELEVIQTGNYDQGCQLLAENLGWSVSIIFNRQFPKVKQ